MPMPVMQVRQMRVRVRERRVLMPVRVRRGALVSRVLVLMMRVMDMPVVVRFGLVRMRVRVLFA